MKLVKSDLASNKFDTKSNDEEADKEWQVMGPKNKGGITRQIEFVKTPISNIFGGFLKSRIHRAGDHSTYNIQPFFTLQLNIEVGSREGGLKDESTFVVVAESQDRA
jgi:ubiquitin carboxyl-terminal hydrolase 10